MPYITRHLFLDIENEFFNDTLTHQAISRDYYRPWLEANSVNYRGATVKRERDKFQVELDLTYFRPEDVTVKAAETYVVIECKHDERQDQHGYITRHYIRKYALPKGCNPDTVESLVSADNMLIVTAPRDADAVVERVVPIAQYVPETPEYLADAYNIFEAA